MALTEQDRIDLNDLINLHGHLMDAGELDRAGELFPPDVTSDVDDIGEYRWASWYFSTSSGGFPRKSPQW
jgi:hypothetical protein